MHANNKTTFKSGDKIRFHIKPNVDGYAYILLRSGSRGEQAQLFPDLEKQENNRIVHGKDIVLPTDGTLAFDENPGIEKLTLLISRHTIDTKTYLQGTDKQPDKIAMSTAGSKDLIPNQVLISYISADSIAINQPEPGPASIKGNSKKTNGNTASVKVGESKVPAARAVHSTYRPKANHTHKFIDKLSIAQPGTVTVVYKDPAGVLAADISLQHL